MPRSRSRYLAAVVGGVVVLLAVWCGRSPGPRFFSPVPGSVAGQPTLHVTNRAVSPTPPARVATEPEAVRERRLLADVAALSAEFDRLRAPPDDIERFRRSAEIENEFMALLDPETASLLIRRMPPGFADTHFGAIALAKWAAAERIVAATWMAAHPAASATAGEALARGWFVENRATLDTHLNQLPPGPWKTQLAITAGEDAFLAHDPAAVLVLLDRAASDDVRRLRLIEWNATAWARIDVEAAAAWAAREPQPARRETLLAAVAVGQANANPAAASVRLLQTVTDPEIRKPAVQALVRIWAARDPEAAASWVGGLPDDSPQKKEAEETLLALAAR